MPTPSEPLCSVGDFTVNNPDELRGLMQSFAVEFGVQMAACLLEDDVTKLVGTRANVCWRGRIIVMERSRAT